MSLVFVAMSGGVDSSVAAALLKEQGHEVVGISMRLHTPDENEAPEGTIARKNCCTLDDFADAARVCDVLDIPFYLLNFEEEFEKKVISYFVSEYEQARTPNPCIACNKHLKFDFFLQKAEAMGGEFVATGHYVQRGNDPETGEALLLKGSDAAKDQSYVLYMLSQEQLKKSLFPIGQYSKTEIREMAHRYKLPVANKAESMDICFIPRNDYRAFLQEKRDQAFQPGPIVDTEGKVLGEHTGLPGYTVGQRKGIGIAGGTPLFVVALDRTRNAVVIGKSEQLWRHNLMASEVNYTGKFPEGPFACQVRIRYHAPDVPAMVYPLGEGRARVKMEQPQRAITPGQAVVFYAGDRVLGGGTIDSLDPENG